MQSPHSPQSPVIGERLIAIWETAVASSTPICRPVERGQPTALPPLLRYGLSRGSPLNKGSQAVDGDPLMRHFVPTRSGSIARWAFGHLRLGGPPPYFPSRQELAGAPDPRGPSRNPTRREAAWRAQPGHRGTTCNDPQGDHGGRCPPGNPRGCPEPSPIVRGASAGRRYPPPGSRP